LARPDFFIVGAPRCGTTAMYEYLRRHPQVFMPAHKEPQYFGADLTHLHERLSEAAYLRLFAAARRGQRVGEATTWYLYSSSAAQEIAAFDPNARIIIMLRNPVDVMYSLHREALFYGVETIEDFAAALAAEEDRRAGRLRSPTPWREVLYYREAVRFAGQVARYLDRFGADRVKVILFDDFVADTARVYADLLRFLDVDDAVWPEFARVNSSKVARNRGLQSLVVRPPGPLRRVVPLVRRYPFAHRLRAFLVGMNSREQPRPQMDPDMRSRLSDELRPEIEDLARLIRRDLGAWTNEPFG
jgi:hypothetical protein